MPGFFLSLIVCLAMALPGREGVRVAGLAARLGPGAGLLLLAIWLSAAVSSALAAWAATLIAPIMPGPAKTMLLAFALGLGALDLVLRRPPRAPAEPTRSVGAMFVVLLASQITDGARFLVLALALVTAEPVPAALGGMLGTGVVLTMAAYAGAHWTRRVPLRPLGWGLAVLLLLAGIVAALLARGVLG